MEETRLDIPNFIWKYQISSLWRVRTINYRWAWYNRVHANVLASTWYHICSLKWKTHYIHRLLGQTFIGNPNNLPCINHIDWDRSNNILNNLERCTYSQNSKHPFEFLWRKVTKQQMECLKLWRWLNSRQLKVIDNLNSKEFIFSSVTECCRNLGFNRKSLMKVINYWGFVKKLDRYTFIYL